MTNEYEKQVLVKARHKLLEKIEHLNEETHLSEEDVECYKNAFKALYYLATAEKAIVSP